MLTKVDWAPRNFVNSKSELTFGDSLVEWPDLCIPPKKMGDQFRGHRRDNKWNVGEFGGV